VQVVRKKEIKLTQEVLERELWNAAMRVPPPRTPKKKYTRKGKSRFNPFAQED